MPTVAFYSQFFCFLLVSCNSLHSTVARVSAIQGPKAIMACSGHNHRPTCNCPIGNPDHPSRQRFTAPDARPRRHKSPAKRRVKQSRPKTCRCGATVYGVWPKGGFFWAISIEPLVRHTCDYTRRIGKPRIAKSQASEEGWLPLTVESLVFERDIATLRAFSLPLGSMDVEVEDADGLAFDGTPLFRQTAIDDMTIELASRDEISGELTVLQFLGRVVPA